MTEKQKENDNLQTEDKIIYTEIQTTGEIMTDKMKDRIAKDRMTN